MVHYKRYNSTNCTKQGYKGRLLNQLIPLSTGRTRVHRVPRGYVALHCVLGGYVALSCSSGGHGALSYVRDRMCAMHMTDDCLKRIRPSTPHLPVSTLSILFRLGPGVCVGACGGI